MHSPGFFEQIEADVGRLFAKARFAIAKVIGPQALEPVIETLRRDLLAAGLETLAPFGQGFRIGQAEILDAGEAQTGTRGLFRHRRGAGQEAAGKDMALDEVRPGAIIGETRILDRDGLDQRPPARFEHLRDLAEIGRPVGLAHRLDHLDGDDAVEGAGDVAIVLQPELDFFAALEAGEGFLGMGQLRRRQGQAGDASRSRFDEPPRQRAPAAANFKHRLAAMNFQPFDDARQLVLLRGFEIRRVLMPQGRGIEQGRIEPELEELVAEVVMAHDVAAAAAPRIGPEAQLEPVEQAEDRRARDVGAHMRRIGGGQTHQLQEVGGGPVALDVSFGKPHVAA
jgi:hypothetical protein